MCRLNDQILNSVCYCTLQCLIHIVNLLTVTRLYMIDNDLCGKSTTYRPARICLLNCILNALDICYTAVIERCTEAYNKNLILSDIILITRIILRCITGISSEIIRICILALDQSLLCVGQLVPCCLCSLTPRIRLVCSLLHIDCID